MKQSLSCHGMQSAYNDFQYASPLEILRRLVVWTLAFAPGIALVAGLVLLCCATMMPVGQRLYCFRRSPP